MTLVPSPGAAAHRAVAPGVSKGSRLLEETDQRQPLAAGLGLVRGHQPIEMSLPAAELRQRPSFGSGCT